MKKIQLAKFKQNVTLAKKLIATGSRDLVEFAPWDKELYWGTDKEGKGDNHHGRILMKVRRKLIKS